MSVRFSIRVNKHIRNGHHGILLYDSNNQIMWSAAANNLVLEPGIRELNYDFADLPLRPGNYSWFVSLWEDQRKIEELHCFPPLVIATPSHMHPSEHLQGVLNLEHEFKLL